MILILFVITVVKDCVELSVKSQDNLELLNDSAEP